MLYSSNRWQSTRHIVRKHILIFLQQRNNNTRQRFVKFVSVKTYLFVQEYKYRLVCIKSILDITRLSIKTPLFFLFFSPFFHSLFSFHSFFLFSLSFFCSLFFCLFHSLSHHLFLNPSVTIFLQVILSFQFHLIFIHLSWSQWYKSNGFIVFYKRIPILEPVMIDLSVKLSRPTQ